MEQCVFKRSADAAAESSCKFKKEAMDCCQNIADQYFAEETVQQSVNADMVMHLINTAIPLKKEKDALKYLKVVQEIILYKEPQLLDNFVDKIVSFRQDSKAKVRKFVVEFIEKACRKVPQLLPKLIGNLNLLLGDKNIYVQKKVIQTAIHLYPFIIRFLCSMGNVDESMETTWTSISQLKNTIVLLLDSDNVGVHSLVVKFMEIVVLTQTFNNRHTDPKSENLSLDEIAIIPELFCPRKLEDEANEIFSKIINYHGAVHISSANLIVCMQVLARIARKRFEFFPKILEAFKNLHANLPPTLSLSQVKSVRKDLKLHLFTLAEHPAAVTFLPPIYAMLSDLKASKEHMKRTATKLHESKNKSMSKKYNRNRVKSRQKLLNMNHHGRK